jgi:hypothetical protein
MKYYLLTWAIAAFSFSQLKGQNGVAKHNTNDSMNRIELSMQKYEALFKRVQSVSNSDDFLLIQVFRRAFGFVG